MLTESSFALEATSKAGSLMRSSSRSSVVSAYEDFRQRYRQGSSDAVDYATRLAFFEKRRAAVEAHNANPRKTWVAEVNKFTDYTEEEFAALLGYRRHAQWMPASEAATAEQGSGGLGSEMLPGSFLEVRPSASSEMEAEIGTVAESRDWRMQLQHSTSERFTREQGSCGSCWAVAAVGAIETHAERQNILSEPLSYEQLVDCTPNPQRCGGDGGCKGATGELAMEYAMRHGVVPASLYQGGYQHQGDGHCDTKPNAAKAYKISGWVRLRENKLHDLLNVISNTGPAVVSVDASGWSAYASGIFNECERDATVNHAALMIGYGFDRTEGRSDGLSGMGYWLIRNSWGPLWGEQGMIRLERHESDHGETGWCGTDYNPKEGVGCDGGPKSIPVCGMCGVLSDTSYPVGVRAMSRQRGRSSHLIRGRNVSTYMADRDLPDFTY